jgi:hypothetical protein
MQTFTILVRLIEGELWRYFFEVIDIEVLQASYFGVQVPKHRIVCVTSKAGLVSGNPVILEMARRNIGGIVNEKALVIGFHCVAREAELSGFGMREVNGGTEYRRNDRHYEESNEGEDLASPHGGKGRVNSKQSDENDRQYNDCGEGVILQQSSASLSGAPANRRLCLVCRFGLFAAVF